MSIETLPARQIHLDFHTGPQIPDVGADFNADAFAAALADAHVNSVTLFAKCHHGLLYYNTARPERHPGLRPGLDLLREQVEACKRRGIRTPIYLSVQCDEYAAELHPDWISRNPDGTNVGRKPLSNDSGAWQILDMASPYQDFLADQIAEVVRLFKPLDGLFLDMCWDQPSVSRWAKDGMRQAGLDPAHEGDRATYAKRVVRGYMDRYNNLVTDLNGSLPRVWYNSRPKLELAHEKRYLKHIEIEALPTGGWGYTYFPLNVRWARNFGLPFIGMTARFHKSWSDFGGYKPSAALKYEVCQMLAHGGGCSVGDQLHPRGTLDAEAYRLIGDTYAHVERVEPWCQGATPLTEAAVLRDPAGGYAVRPGDTLEGVVRLLQQLLLQFDFLAPDVDWQKYPLVIVPEGIPITPALDAALLAHIVAGHAVLLAGPSLLAAASPALRAAAGVGAFEPAPPVTPFLRYDRALIPDAERSDVVLYDGTATLTPAPGALSPAQIIHPYFQRAWDHFTGHNQTPPSTPTGKSPLTVGTRAAAFGFDPFKAFATHGQSHLRRLLRFALSRLHPRPLLRGTVPTHAELTLTRQPGRTILHVLSFAPQRRTPTLDLVEEATPLVSVPVEVRTDTPIQRVRLEPAGVDLPHTTADGYTRFTLTSTNGHDVVVLE